MDTTIKLHPGQTFSPEVFKRIDGPDYTFGASGQWQALFVFRGQHCPICQAYLGKIEERREVFRQAGGHRHRRLCRHRSSDAGDHRQQQGQFPDTLRHGYPDHAAPGALHFRPVSARETDHRFPEPALLVVNAESILQIVDIANAPFARPDLELLLQGLGFVIEKHYPTRGTYR